MNIDKRVACIVCMGEKELKGCEDKLERCSSCDGTGYKFSHHIKFCQDMRKVGIAVRHYSGRFFWTGPAAYCEYTDDVTTKTELKCSYEVLGRGFIVWPLEQRDQQ